MNTIKVIITGILSFLLMIGVFYLGSWYAVGSFIISICIYTLLAYSIAYLWRTVRKRQIPDPVIFIQNFLFSISIFLTILVVLFGGFAYNANENHPATLKQYTLSNGEKTVIFQSMIHIGRPEFYKQVQEEIIKVKEKGGVYFYEGVREGSQKNHNDFNKALGIEFDKDLYKNFSKLYGITQQDNQTFLHLVNDLDFNVDTSIDEVMTEYNKIKKIASEPKQVADINADVLDLLNGLTPRQLTLLQYINKALLNTIIGSEGFLDSIQSAQNKELFDIILHKRNEYLAESIIHSEYQTIFVTYGGLHFKGLLELLQENNPDWSIISEKDFYPITEKK